MGREGRRTVIRRSGLYACWREVRGTRAAAKGVSERERAIKKSQLAVQDNHEPHESPRHQRLFIKENQVSAESTKAGLDRRKAKRTSLISPPNSLPPPFLEHLNLLQRHFFRQRKLNPMSNPRRSPNIFPTSRFSFRSSNLCFQSFFTERVCNPFR